MTVSNRHPNKASVSIHILQCLQGHDEGGFLRNGGEYTSQANMDSVANNNNANLVWIAC